MTPVNRSGWLEKNSPWTSSSASGERALARLLDEQQRVAQLVPVDDERKTEVAASDGSASAR